MFGCALLKSIVGCVECSDWSGCFTPCSVLALGSRSVLLLWPFMSLYVLCFHILFACVNSYIPAPAQPSSFTFPLFLCPHHVQCPVCLNVRGDLSAANTHKQTGSSWDRPDVHVSGIALWEGRGLCALIWRGVTSSLDISMLKSSAERGYTV